MRFVTKDGTKSYKDIAKYGEVMTRPKFTAVYGTHADIAEAMTRWQKFDGSNWVSVNNETQLFEEGKYCVTVQVRCDYGNKTYKLADGFKLYVDDVEWTNHEDPDNSELTYSYCWVLSEEITIVPGPLIFSNKEFDKEYIYKDELLSFYVAGGASGGKKSYTFSKVSGPDWLAVGTDGNVSGKPTAEGTNANLKIQVKDQEGTTKEIEIPVAKTTLHPDDRTAVTETSATSDYLTVIGYGKESKMPAFTMADGSMAYVDEGTAITKIQNVIENVGGGVEPYTFSIEETTWLAINSSTGEISGTPAATDVSETEKELTIKVTDSEDPAASATIKIKVGKVYPTFAHRTEVTEVEATSNISSLIGYAVISQKPTFTMADGQKANIPEEQISWWKNVGGEWQQMSIGERFNVGEYKVRILSQIGGETAKFYKLKADGVTVKVDGKAWTVSGIFSSDETDYSYAKAESPVMTVTNTGAPLKFDKKREFEIPVSYVGEPIAGLDVTSGVTGGTEPYVFSITSPATTWLTIGSADGKIKGQPSAMGDNEPLVVRVTDAMGDYKEITIIVGKTTIRPGDRSVISEVTATSDYADIPGYAKDNKKPAVTVTSAIASIPEDLIEWQKFNGSDWWGYGEGTFTGGKYRVKVEVYISGDNGTQYMLSDPFTLKVDGVEWTVTDIHIEDTRSYGTAYSPEIKVVNTGIISIGADGTRTANVYTLTGTLVKARATNEDLRRLPSGVYVVSGKKFVKK